MGMSNSTARQVESMLEREDGERGVESHWSAEPSFSCFGRGMGIYQAERTDAPEYNGREPAVWHGFEPTDASDWKKAGSSVSRRPAR